MTILPTPRILVIRRDNIGDLVCTTPLIHALRQRFPQGWLGALVNSYNAPVLSGSPDLDELFVYTKAKHREAGESLPGIFWRRLRMLRRLRRMGLDDVIIATPLPQARMVRLARWLKPRRVIAFGPCGADLELPLTTEPLHEVEHVFRIAREYGIEGAPPACRIQSAAAQTHGADADRIAIHVSARKPSQRWPAERFVALIRMLRQTHPGLRFRLLWAPGPADDPRHPGDDEKARSILQALDAQGAPDAPDAGCPIEPVATRTLPELIQALAGCGALICADGGAMHLGAGLGLPIVCLFGDSSTERWRPWEVPCRVLQKPSRQVTDIAVEEVAAAFNALRGGIPAPSP